MVNGNLVSQVHQTFSPFAKQTIKLKKCMQDVYMDDCNFIEFEYEIGPLPGNRELITRFSTDINNARTIYTDNNAEILFKREYHNFPNDSLKELYPNTGNYHPVQYSSIIQDMSKQLIFTTNSSRGVASLLGGSVEFMLHRRTLQDDWRGLDEPLNDTSITHISLRLMLDSVEKKGQFGMRQYHSHIHNFPLDIFYFDCNLNMTIFEFSRSFYSTYEPISLNLPPWIHLLTFNVQKFDGKELIIVRLMNMVENADKQVVTSTIDIKMMFNKYHISYLAEMNLAATTIKQEVKDMKVELAPLVIRTFLAIIKSI